MATAPKSNSAILGIEAALADIRAGKTGDIPAHIGTRTTAARPNWAAG